MNKPLVNNKYLLQKFNGKGGWTFAAIPEIKPNSKNPFGWVRVSGFIDTVEIKQYHLMPMGNGQLFLPVKAAIRKAIKKQEGDWISVQLFLDEEPLHVPDELLHCLQDEPAALAKFLQLSDSEKAVAIKNIYAAKKDDTRTEKIVQLIKRLIAG
jgi:Domain of unknown function (DUF1905)/Bacteriocin-protection, YdeI or OmpD-Associated